MLPRSNELCYCNCASCQRRLLGEKSEKKLYAAIVLEAMTANDPVVRETYLRAMYDPGVRGRIDGRPYCDNCLQVHYNREKDGHEYPTTDDPEDDRVKKRKY